MIAINTFNGHTCKFDNYLGILKCNICGFEKTPPNAINPFSVNNAKNYDYKCVRCGYGTESLNEEGFCECCVKEVRKKRYDKFNNL